MARHHENQLVSEAVEKYEKALTEGRPDMDPKQVDKAVASYKDHMNQVWNSPERGSNKSGNDGNSGGGRGGGSNDKSR